MFQPSGRIDMQANKGRQLVGLTELTDTEYKISWRFGSARRHVRQVKHYFGRLEVMFDVGQRKAR